MAVFIDHARQRFRWMVTSHMMADTSEELLAMAIAIGMKPEWIQCPGTAREHFDVPAFRRTRAIARGAVAVRGAELGALMRRKRDAGMPDGRRAR